MIYMTPEESLEMMLTILNDYGMMDYVQPGTPGVFKSFYTLKKLTEKFLPKVHELFTAVDFRPEMYATRWFMNIFVGDFPIETVVRIWDIFLEEGRIIIYKVSLAYLALLEPKILKENSMEGMFRIFQKDGAVETEALL